MKLEKQKEIFEGLKEEFGFKNIWQSPRIEKIVVSSGTGKKVKTDRFRNDVVSERLAKITGQKPAIRGAKFSIAGFKIRQGDPVGQVVTLRGRMAENFFDKLVHIALPRTKDFRGVNRTAVDEMGNLTIGVKEHTIFPETGDEDIKDIFGMSITIVTSAKNKEVAIKYLEKMGVPFKKIEE